MVFEFYIQYVDMHSGQFYLKKKTLDKIFRQNLQLESQRARYEYAVRLIDSRRQMTGILKQLVLLYIVIVLKEMHLSAGRTKRTKKSKATRRRRTTVSTTPEYETSIYAVSYTHLILLSNVSTISQQKCKN